MPANAAVISPAESVDSGSGLVTRLVRYFKAQVDDWYDVCRQLSVWEERYLIDDPRQDRLAEHARQLDELEQVGHWFELATQSSDFPDRSISELVAMTLQDLRDRRALWHGTMTSEQRESLLRDIFHES